jgi:TonB family protein
VRNALIAMLVASAFGCGGASPVPAGDGAQAGPPPEAEAPVALNPDVPIAYPVAPFEQRIDGDVVLRLFVDSTGRLVPESTRVAESSNYPALDSAALAGSSRLHFAPAKRRGVPVATAFLQPVEFRHAGTAAGGAAPPPAATLPAPRPATVATDAPPAQRAAPRPLLRLPSDTAKRVTPPVADSLRPRPDTTTDTTRAARDTSGRSH